MPLQQFNSEETGTGIPAGLSRSKADAKLEAQLNALSESIKNLNQTIAKQNNPLGGGAESFSMGEFSRIMKEAVKESTEEISERLVMGGRRESPDGTITHAFAQWKKDVKMHSEEMQKEYEEKTKYTEKIKVSTDFIKNFSKETGSFSGIIEDASDALGVLRDQGLAKWKEGIDQDNIDVASLGIKMVGFADKATLVAKSLGQLTLVLGTIGIFADQDATRLRANIGTMNQLGFDQKEQLSVSTRWFGDPLKNHENEMRNWLQVDPEITRRRVSGLQKSGIGALEENPTARANEILGLDKAIAGLTIKFGASSEILEKTAQWLYQQVGLKGDNVGNALARMAQNATKAGLSVDVYTQTVGTLHDQTKQYGASVRDTEAMIVAFGDQIRKGTVSIGQLAGMMAPEKLGMGQQAFLAQRMGYSSGDIFKDAHDMQRDARGTPEGRIRFIENLMRVVTETIPGGSESQRIAVAQMFAKVIGVDLPQNMDEFSKTTTTAMHNLKSARQRVGASMYASDEFVKDAMDITASGKNAVQFAKDVTALAGQALTNTGGGIDPIRNIATGASVLERMGDKPRLQYGEETMPLGGNAKGGRVTLNIGTLQVNGAPNTEDYLTTMEEIRRMVEEAKRR